ncbi:MAG: hypothetical protein AAGC53_20275 [Actinomycetota bacterium]
MFGSQALETAIGLVVMFFVIALASSTIVEIYSRLLTKRGKDLEAVITVMLQGGGDPPDPPGAEPIAPAPNATDAEKATYAQDRKSWEEAKTAHDAWSDAMDAFKTTSIFSSLAAATKTGVNGGLLGLRRVLDRDWIKRAVRRVTADRVDPDADRFPSYVSARSFADAVGEVIVDKKHLENLPPGLQKRVTAILHEARNDATKIKAGLEGWFDDTMDRVEGAYKRWATVCLFVVGLGITITANASAIDVARALWVDTATREAVADAASALPEGTEIESVAEAVDQLEELKLPIGWDDGVDSVFPDLQPWTWQWSTIGGWLVTALLVMMGAPFWYGLLTKLVALRSSGSKPSAAVDDPASSTTALAKPKPDPLGGLGLMAMAAATGAAAGGGGGGVTTSGTAPAAPPSRASTLDDDLRSAFGLT